MFSDPVRHSRICRNDITNLWFNERICVFVCAFPLPAFHRGAGFRNIDRKLPLSDKLDFGGESPLTIRHGRWVDILHPLDPSTISCYEIGICRAAANNRKPCHPEHSVSDFGFHDCRWQSFCRKSAKRVVEGSFRRFGRTAQRMWMILRLAALAQDDKSVCTLVISNISNLDSHIMYFI